MRRTLIFWFALSLVLSMQLTGWTQDATCYWNPQGGRYFHNRKDCETIAPEYWDAMGEIGYDSLKKKPYNELMQCPVCYNQNSFTPTLNERLSFSYKSAYDTAEEGAKISTSGDYQAGVAFLPGIYTLSCNASCVVTIISAKQNEEILRTYHMEGRCKYTIYMGEGMRIILPTDCTMEKVKYSPAFQNDVIPLEIQHGRYITRYELPMRVFHIKSIPGKIGYYIVSSIRAELGEENSQRVDIPSETTKRLDLGSQYDTFVELVNCIIWPEVGEG